MFVYTSHAEHRIRQRRISKARIERTVLQPDKVLAGFEKRMLAQRDFSGSTLEVVYVQEQDVIVIVTAYTLEEEHDHQLR